MNIGMRERGNVVNSMNPAVEKSADGGIAPRALSLRAVAIGLAIGALFVVALFWAWRSTRVRQRSGTQTSPEEQADHSLGSLPACIAPPRQDASQNQVQERR